METQETELGQEEPHRGCWVVAQAESTGQTYAELWLERDLRLPDLRLAVEGRHREQWDTAGRAQRLLPACLLPVVTLRNARRCPSLPQQDSP